MEEDESKSHGNKSIFTSLKEKLGFNKTTTTTSTEPTKKSILSPIRRVRKGADDSGEHNFSHGFSSFASTPLGANHSSNINGSTNKHVVIEEIPRKRVKFDEENLIVSSITYQRQHNLRETRNKPQPPPSETESLFTRFINFTANLF
jgi:hypothetical protein